MGKYDTNLIDKMKADVEIPKVVDDKLEEVYEKICLGEVKMKQTKRGGKYVFYARTVSRESTAGI